jgi:glycosyltransferase involved in cell wall biosynthesis
MRTFRPVRLAVHSDYLFSKEGDDLYADRAFATFIARLGESLDALVLIGRLDPKPGRGHYRLPRSLDFVPLPYAADLSRPRDLFALMLRSLRPFWNALDRVDAVWLVGSYVLTIPFAALATLKRKRVVLGIRQDMPRYIRGRHPRRRWLHIAADLLEAVYRALSRFVPTIVVGPKLAENYRGARRLLALTVSLIEEKDIVPAEQALARPYDGELRILTVGRLETEKNPLLLAEVLASLSGNGRPWRLVVCGEGPMREELEQRVRELGIDDRFDFRGYVPIDGGLLDLYRSSHAFLHVSWTEGLPQTLFEAFAAGLPVVATAVGGVPQAVDGAALLMPPGDPGAAVEALSRVADDAELRGRLIERALAIARDHTIDSECRRVADFLSRSL